jgi:hypothetical protein
VGKISPQIWLLMMSGGGRADGFLLLARALVWTVRKFLGAGGLINKLGDVPEVKDRYFWIRRR